jgi:hypothetical protein
MLHWHPNKEHICCSDKSFHQKEKEGEHILHAHRQALCNYTKEEKKTSRREKGNPFPVFDFIQVTKG